MHVQERSHTMACSMVVVEPISPKPKASHRIQFRASSPNWEHSHSKINMALQHTCKATALMISWIAEMNGASDVSGSVKVLCSRVYEVHSRLLSDCGTVFWLRVVMNY